MQVKKIIFITIFILWITIIFVFSHQSGTKSENTSDNLVKEVLETLNIDMNKKEKENFIIDTRIFVRKGAHFILYLGLGVISYLTLTAFNIKKKLSLSIIITSLYAISDEIHQIFIPSRTAAITDVLIDISGSIIGILIINKVYNLSKKSKNSLISCEKV